MSAAHASSRSIERLGGMGGVSFKKEEFKNISEIWQLRRPKKEMS